MSIKPWQRRRFVWKVGALLLLGAMVNVLVAWACSAWCPYVKPWSARLAAGVPPLAEMDSPEDHPVFDSRRYDLVWGFEAGVGIRRYAATGWSRPDPKWRNYMLWDYRPTLYESGWPMRSMRSLVHMRPDQRRWDLPWCEILSRGVHTRDLPGALRTLSERRLSLVPIPIGFAVNTAFYAMAAAGAMGATRTLARRRPAKRMGRGFPVVSSTRDPHPALDELRRTIPKDSVRLLSPQP